MFERQATGGAFARDGFEYQDAYLLEHLPLFLSQSAFSHVVSENMGDIDVRYHRPSGGTWCVGIEAKRNQLTSNELWSEVARFVQMHEASPDEYVRFVLVCGDYAGAFDPLFSKLARLRGVAASLNPDSAILMAAEHEIENTIVALGQTVAIARFVRERVSFAKYSDNNVNGSFASALNENLPALSDMRGNEVNAFRDRCKELVDHSVKGVVHRCDIEAALVNCAPGLAAAWLGTASQVQLLPATSHDIEQLSIEVGEFNGDNRGRLGKRAWENLQGELNGFAEFLRTSRARAGVALSAKQRMSLACTIGYCFSATRGFTLQMHHNGAVFDTAKHEREDGRFFKLPEVSTGDGGDGVVSISFPYPGRDDILTAASRLGLGAGPQLHIEGTGPLVSLAALNTAVHEAKTALVAFRTAHQLQRLHVFLKVPSVFAVVLGHRLNGVGEVQLYDWVDSSYHPTALLA